MLLTQLIDPPPSFSTWEFSCPQGNPESQLSLLMQAAVGTTTSVYLL